MEKCWFILKQSQYPPPQDRNGPLQLGHIIPSHTQLDRVINIQNGPLPRLRGMTVHETAQENFTLGLSGTSGVNLSLNATVPVDPTGLIGAGGHSSFVHGNTQGNHWQFQRLDTSIMQPTYTYIRRSVEDEDIKEYVQKFKPRNSWKLFMITGIAVARGALSRGSETTQLGVDGGPALSLGGLANVGASVGIATSGTSAMSFESSTDFIWAIRITKIEKRMFHSELRFDTYTKGATYTSEDKDSEDIQAALETELESTSFGAIIDKGKDIYVLPKEDNTIPDV